MKKSIVVFLLISMLSLSFVGCSSAKAETLSSDTKTRQASEVLGEVSASAASSLAGGDERFPGYRLLEVEGGDISGAREANVVVDIGYGDREYWAFTNEYGQLVRVEAKEIILQDESNEAVSAQGRYFSEEAEVPGTELPDFDQGHIIADSLGGVANAYNITPQDSVLNRHGDQAYMEDTIRKAGGCTDFTAVITYPNENTHIPSHYSYTYTLNGNVIYDEFDNVNPDNVPITSQSEAVVASTNDTAIVTEAGATEEDISGIDTNGNGTVTIAEAKAAGFSMPIMSDHWLYKYMIDKDKDGMVGE